MRLSNHLEPASGSVSGTYAHPWELAMLPIAAAGRVLIICGIVATNLGIAPVTVACRHDSWRGTNRLPHEFPKVETRRTKPNG